MERPEVGKTYGKTTKGGKQTKRTVDRVEDLGEGWQVWYNGRSKGTWCATWDSWVRGAEIEQEKQW